MRILAVNFFPAFHPPRSGGEQRYYYLYRHLSERHDVTLLSPTYATHPGEIVEFSPAFREHRVPKDPVFDQIHWKLAQEGIGPECSGYVVALAGGCETAFGRAFARLAVDADLIVHDSPFTLPYDRTIDEDGKPRVYNAYNVEHRLAAQWFQGERGRKSVAFIRFLEAELTRRATRVLVTSDEEAEQFHADFGVDLARIVLVPNGFEPESAANGDVVRGGDVLFMGSAHPPNVEAALHIVERLAPALPETPFILIGSACSRLPGDLPPNVRSLGVVDENEKRQLLRECAVAINPLFSGAGTNLKMLDYLAAGAPVVTTPIGARGLGLVDGDEAFIVEPDGFPSVLRAVLAHAGRAARVAASGKKKVYERYAWPAIARRADDALSTLLSRSQQSATSLPFLLVVNDFSVLQPVGGGQVRIHELLTELGRTFEVALLCFTQEPEPYRHLITAHVVEIGIPKTARHRDAEVEAARGEVVSVNDVLAADHVLDNELFVKTFAGLASRAQGIIFEHPFLAPLMRHLPDGVPFVYSSLNVETELKAGLLATRSDAAHWTRRAAELERAMVERADLVISVCEYDAAWFRRKHSGKRVVVVENGCRVKRGERDPMPPVPSRALDRPLAIFVGSGHMPNVEAARFIVDVVAPSLPGVIFGLLGSVCDAVRLVDLPPNVALFGMLPEREKDALLARATLAVNPLFGGGGSSLKVPDFLAAGLPLVSTAVGIRGYGLQRGVHYVEARQEEFATVIRRLVDDSRARSGIAAAGHEYAARELDWRALGRKYRAALREHAGIRSSVRTLVVTYRFADPPPGGAEAYLVNMLRAIHDRSRIVVDVATPDVGAIHDHWHFSARYDAPAQTSTSPAYVDSLRRFALDPAPGATFERCRTLFAQWMRETREQARMLLREADRCMLLGGWNFGETAQGRTVRWTSEHAEVCVGPDLCSLHVEGFAPHAVEFEVRRGKQRRNQWVSGRFVIDAELGAGDPIVEIMVDPRFAPEDDPRELGVLVERLSLKRSDGVVDVSLDEDVFDAARRADPDAWVGSLIEVAQARPTAIDELFSLVRGPWSSGLERWLECRCADYDVMLVHGVPFATFATVTRIGKSRHVPVVLLPHFHLEDRYYHWQEYYRAFAAANCVLAAPRATKSLLLDPLGAHSVVVPGGGIDKSEYLPARMAEGLRHFRAVHDSDTPFVLVLGRKAGAKRYSLVIDAVGRLREAGRRVHLVMIGPDDDGIAISDAHVFYYGPQPRDVVIGALHAATCLVNMSDSESFGIVLLEAWAASTPVVAQRKCEAFAELVREGENGFLTETPAEIASAIDRYLADTGLRARHASAGRRIASEYTWPAVAAVIEQELFRAAHGTATHASGSSEDREGPVRTDVPVANALGAAVATRSTLPAHAGSVPRH